MVSDEALPQERRLGEDAGRRLAGWLAALGVARLGGVEVAAIEPDGGRGRTVRLAEGTAVPADAVLLATGAAPGLDLPRAAGLDVSGGAVAVDARMRTRTEGVLAAGDVALAQNAAAGRPLRVEHWGEALAQGEIAGRSAAGARAEWRRAPGFWSTIGRRTVKHVAWGDGWDEARMVEEGEGFTVWYGRHGVTVGVLTHQRDEDYERGRELVERGAPLP
jgi:NADPH-dependent 2,4-dienoyl-CoA reductase/sulfur reductase-like enzyme